MHFRFTIPARLGHDLDVSLIKIIESQNGRGWKRPLGIIWSNPVIHGLAGLVNAR